MLPSYQCAAVANPDATNRQIEVWFLLLCGYAIGGQPKGQRADGPCPSCRSFGRNISAKTRAAQAIPFHFRLSSMLFIAVITNSCTTEFRAPNSNAFVHRQGCATNSAAPCSLRSPLPYSHVHEMSRFLGRSLFNSATDLFIRVTFIHISDGRTPPEANGHVWEEEITAADWWIVLLQLRGPHSPVP